MEFPWIDFNVLTGYQVMAYDEVWLRVEDKRGGSRIFKRE